jgi:hypothetical protein
VRTFRSPLRIRDVRDIGRYVLALASAQKAAQRHGRKVDDGPSKVVQRPPKALHRPWREEERHHVLAIPQKPNIRVPHQRQLDRFESDRVDRLAVDHSAAAQPRSKRDVIAVHIDSVPEESADPGPRDEHAVKRLRMAVHVHTIGIRKAAANDRSRALRRPARDRQFGRVGRRLASVFWSVPEWVFYCWLGILALAVIAILALPVAVCRGTRRERRERRD